MLELYAIASGEVQAVGFRATAKAYAKDLHLTGVVKNLADGTVELIAQGAQPDLETLVTRLQERFDAKIRATYRNPQHSYPNFSIA